MNDDLMDARLAEAGQRWREANAAVATVDLDAVVVADELPLEFPAPPAHRRLWPWLVAAAAVLLIAAGLVAIVRPSSTHHAADGVDNSTAKAGLSGTSWRLANATPVGGGTSPAAGDAVIAFAADGTVQGNDGCNQFSGKWFEGGTATASPTIAVGSATYGSQDSVGTVTFRDISATTVGCLDENLGPQRPIFSMLLSGGTDDWQIYGGNKLALSRDGAGTLVFVRGAVEPDRAAASLVGSGWRLETIERGNSATSYEWADVAPYLAFDVANYDSVAGYDGCNPVRGTYTVNGSTLSLDVTVTTTTRCTNGYSGLIDSVLTAAKATWQISLGTLTLTAGTTKLIFRAYAVPHSTPTGIATAPSPAGTLSAAPTDSPLADTKWLLSTVSTSRGSASDTSNRPPHLIFGSGGSFQFVDACHSWSGKAVVSATTLRLTSATPNTSQLCAADASVEKALPIDGSAISWSRADGPLVIKHAGVTLTFLRFGL